MELINTKPETVCYCEFSLISKAVIICSNMVKSPYGISLLRNYLYDYNAWNDLSYY